MMGTVVQIFGAEHYEDALAVAALGVDHLGFRVEDPAFSSTGETCLTVAEAKRLFRELPAETVTVALFATPDVELVLRVVEGCRPRMVQVCWDAEAVGVEREARLRARLGEVKLIKEIPVGGAETRPVAIESALRYERFADTLILDTHTDGRWIGASGQTHDWSISEEIVRRVGIPCILAGGLDEANVAEAMGAVRPWGVDSYSRTNLPDGRKNLARVGAFVAAVRRFDGGSVAEEVARGLS